MVVLLQFEPDWGALREDVAADLMEVPPAAFGEDLFQQKVTLAIDDTVLINRWLPILDIAMAGLQALDAIATSDTHHMLIPGGGDLDFVREGPDIVIRRRDGKAAGRATLDDLRRAWELFSQSVADAILAVAPHLRERPELGPWLGSHETRVP